MLPSFPSNAYADHCLLLNSDGILPSKLPPSFLSFSPSVDSFLGGHDQENELHLLTQSFNCSSLDHSARRVPFGITNVKSMMPQAEGVAVPSFPNDTSIAGHGIPCTGTPPNFDHPNNNSENNNKADCNKGIIENIFVAGDHQQRKRSGKKDRHSKIVTAQGPRDRRMRLSLDIARRFFDLQDRLGYDKASKTVEWLMSKSKGAIKEVMQGLLHPKDGPCGGRSLSSYTSDCDDTSGVEETPIDYNEDADLHEQNYPFPIITSTGPKSRKNKTVRKPAFILPHGKESRAMARARARERAKEKLSRRMEIGHEKKTTTATTTITSRCHPQLEQQGLLHFANYPQQTITPIAITNPDVNYNIIHEDWAAHGGIRY